MAKCLDCTCVYGVFGGSKGSKCPKCHSINIDTSKEITFSYDYLIKARKELTEATNE